MEKFGTVSEVCGENVVVTVVRDSACGDNCAACGLCSNSREMKVTLKNNAGLRKGDKVRLVSEDKKVLGTSALGYLSLTALLIVGTVVGGLWGNDRTAFFGAVIGVAVGVVLLKLFFKNKIDIEIQKLN